MDLGDQADEAWLLSVQHKLYQWNKSHSEDSYPDLWNWTTLNRGRRTAGVDWMTVTGIRAGG